jgi:hypothetical protein
MDDCIHVLETHPDALPSDRQVVWWAKLGFIMEEAGVQLMSDDQVSMSSFADGKTRYTVRAFNNQLTQWRKNIPEDCFTSKSYFVDFAYNSNKYSSYGPFIPRHQPLCA